MPAPAADSVRAFIAITLAPAQMAHLQELQRELRSRLTGHGIRWVRPDQLHLTLRFLGNVDRERLADLSVALHQACAGAAPFPLAFEGVGCFPDTGQPRVIWAGLRGELDSLQRIQARVRQGTQSFGDHQEERAFRPHLTIGRVEKGGRESREVRRQIESVRASTLEPWTVRQIHLIQSQLTSAGPRYTALTSIAIGD
jgi:2'-5' RNA ligase